jgi:hypothetical protein
MSGGTHVLGHRRSLEHLVETKPLNIFLIYHKNPPFAIGTFGKKG